MVSLVILCSLIGSVVLVLVCGAIAPVVPPPTTMISPPAIIEPDTSITPPTTVVEEEYDNMQHDTIKNSLREGIVIKSIEVMRKDGVDDEAIKKKMMECFSLDEETMDRLLAN